MSRKILVIEDSVLALTAYAMKGDDQKTFDAGRASCISKPIDTRSLPAVIADN